MHKAERTGGGREREGREGLWVACLMSVCLSTQSSSTYPSSHARSGFTIINQKTPHKLR